MVLVVVADVERDTVDRAVVRERLLPFRERVVLVDEVRCDGMETVGEEECDREVRERAPSEREHDARIHDQHDGASEELLHVRALRERETSRDVDDRMEKQPRELARGPATDEARLEGKRQIGVGAEHVEVAVVIDVVAVEGERHREDHREVRDHRDGGVAPRGASREAVRRLVDGHGEPVRERRADGPGEDRDGPPRERGNERRERELHHGNGDRDVRGAPIEPEEGANLGEPRDERAPAKRVRLARACQDEGRRELVHAPVETRTGRRSPRWRDERRALRDERQVAYPRARSPL